MSMNRFLNEVTHLHTINDYDLFNFLHCYCHCLIHNTWATRTFIWFGVATKLNLSVIEMIASINCQNIIGDECMLKYAFIYHLLFPIFHATMIYLSGNVEIFFPVQVNNFIYWKFNIYSRESVNLLKLLLFINPPPIIIYTASIVSLPRLLVASVIPLCY